METFPVKSIVLTCESEDWFGEKYRMNLYRGCSHGCIYCDSRSECYRIDNFDTVRAKAGALTIVEQELRRKVLKGVIGTGSMSDPYNPFERQEKLTRGALELIRAYHFGVSIATKGTLVTRDIDLLQAIQKKMPVLVRITITTIDDKLSLKIEPNAPPSSERFAALAELARAGIPCGILIMPVLPYITDSEENLMGLLDRAAECGAGFIYSSFGVTLRGNQFAYYCARLDDAFPGLRARTVSAYGGQYYCPIPRADEIHRVFTDQCQKRNLLHRMRDITSWYQRGYEDQQLTFL